jgi:hypothetical protein
VDKKKLTNIEDRETDYKQITEDVWRTELGVRSICVMYDDHSADKNSKDNIFLLKDNIQYRLFSAAHQYLIFLRELSISERYLQDLHKKDPKLFNAFPLGNPYFDKVELELSSVFDSIIFQLSSVFDYLSHTLCYMIKKNKSDTLYWTKLASSARDKNNDLYKLDIAKLIDEIDREFVGRLYDYRSRLLHNKRDQHRFMTTVQLSTFNFNLKILASDTSLKHFKVIRKEVPEGDITLTYLSSWLLKEGFDYIEKLLDGLREEILKTSVFYQNVRKPKADNGFMIVMHDKETNTVKPTSDGLWKQYKDRKKASR